MDSYETKLKGQKVIKQRSLFIYHGFLGNSQHLYILATRKTDGTGVGFEYSTQSAILTT